MDLDSIRNYIKNELQGKPNEICDLADEVQGLGYRICPRNIYQDEKSKKTCSAIVKGECRKRFATCFKKYFKEGSQNEKELRNKQPET